MTPAQAQAITWTARIAVIGGAVALVASQCGCASRRAESTQSASRATLAVEALRAVQTHAAGSAHTTVEDESGPIVYDFPAWSPPDGGLPERPVKVTIGPSKRKAVTASTWDAGTTEVVRVTVDAGTESTTSSTKTSDFRPSWGLNLWLVAVPAGLLAAAAIAWRFYGPGRR